MKKILSMIMALTLLMSGCAIVLTILLVGSVSAENWIHSTDGVMEGKKAWDFYYKAGFGKTESGTTVMKMKLVFTDWGKQYEIKNNPSLLHLELSYATQIWEFNIKENKIRPLRFTYFDSEDTVLKDEVFPNSEWLTPNPGSILEVWMTIAKGH